MITGVLLINLGTPAAPTTASVRSYLREFLSDPDVIALPWPLRYLLLYGIILPFRPQKTAQLYQKIWSNSGSPLLVHSEALRMNVAQQLGSNFVVTLGMRYGHPSIEAALQKLYQAQCKKIIIFPLYPQYSRSATKSALRKTKMLMRQQARDVIVKIQQDFFDAPWYIDSEVSVIREYLAGVMPEHFIFSYHGLPRRAQQEAQNYRNQCIQTSNLLAQKLNLPHDQYSVAFQSRMQRGSWIVPYTDETLIQLAQRGIKDLVVVCPGFVADCLETLEEIGIRAKAQWLSLGGHSFRLVPALNNDPAWIGALSNHIININHDKNSFSQQ